MARTLSGEVKTKILTLFFISAIGLVACGSKAGRMPAQKAAVQLRASPEATPLPTLPQFKTAQIISPSPTPASHHPVHTPPLVTENHTFPTESNISAPIVATPPTAVATNRSLSDESITALQILGCTSSMSSPKNRDETVNARVTLINNGAVDLTNLKVNLLGFDETPASPEGTAEFTSLPVSSSVDLMISLDSSRQRDLSFQVEVISDQGVASRINIEPCIENVTASSIVTSSLVMPAGVTGNWRLTFADEFDGSALDQTNWNTCHWWDNAGCTISSNNELEWYLPQNVMVQNGTLILEARAHPVTGSNNLLYPYTSGMVTTGQTYERDEPPGFTFRYGFAEIRARVPSGRGLWPAFWMLPISHNSKPEIDIMEILGHVPQQVEMHYHYIGAGGVVSVTGDDWVGPDFSQGWHTFGVDWQPDSITWYVDGVARFTVTDQAYISSEPMYLILNLAVGGNWPGSPDANTIFPSRFEVDYVRVFERTDTAYLAPLQDTYIDSSDPDTDLSLLNAIYADGEPVKISLIKYDTAYLVGRQIATAHLRIQTTEEIGSTTNDPSLISILGSCNRETTLSNFTKFVMPASKPIGKIENAVDVNTVYLISIHAGLIQTCLGARFTLSISSDGTDGLYLFSSESLRGGPQLILTFSDDDSIYR